MNACKKRHNHTFLTFYEGRNNFIFHNHRSDFYFNLLAGTFADTDVVVEIDLLSDDGQGNSMNRACTNILINDMDTNAESIQSNREYSTTSSFSAWTSEIAFLELLSNLVTFVKQSETIK